jgi:decaprenylphospho-beta-D-ribofuranose 2-oxidase
VPEVETLHGWGRTAPVRCNVAPLEEDSVAEQVRGAGHRGVLARGLGRSYGDAAQNSGGLVLLPAPTRIAVDEAAGTVEVSAGTSLHDLICDLLPRGLFLHVTPGTRQVSVGGAIASDVHGKNHYRDGSFADHVVSFDLVGPDGRTTVVTPEGEPELFWATAGGMGLTGVITRAVLEVRPVESSYLTVTSERLSDLATVMVRMLEAASTHGYAAAWVDLTAHGPALGRAVLGVGDHARRDQLSVAAARDPLALPQQARVRVPVTPPRTLVARSTVRAFNEVWFRKASARPTGTIEHLGGFFHPLDAVGGWNRLYGPRGLVQYQVAIPDGAEGVVEAVVRRISQEARAPFLGVLKRLGPANRGWLSFPVQGWTLAADFPASPALAGLFHDLDAEVAGAGGRVYLAKDSTCGPETLRRMYPRAEEFRARRVATGAGRVFVSDLSRRLSL